MTGKQAQIFLGGEGQAWLNRNEGKLPPKEDPVLDAIKAYLIKPKRVLEIGCANGWRLEALEKEYKCLCTGIDPGAQISFMRSGRIDIHRGVANNLGLFKDHRFDLLIYGFCLYLCDPEDYFRIVTEGDRVLADGGYLVIYDFALEIADYPHARKYEHKEDVLSHRMRWEYMWAWHPAYTIRSVHLIGDGDDKTKVVILKKETSNAFPVRA